MWREREGYRRFWWVKNHLINGDVKYHTYLERLRNMLSEFTEDTILGSVKSIKKQGKDKVRKNKFSVSGLNDSKCRLLEGKKTNSTNSAH